MKAVYETDCASKIIAFMFLAFLSAVASAADLKITVTDPSTGKTVSEYEKSYTPEERNVEQKTVKSTKTGCEITSYNQGGRSSGGGHISPGGNIFADTETCVNLTIRNHDSVVKTITPENIIATTDRHTVTPKRGFSIKIEPHGTYSGDICFGRHLGQITRIECRP